MILSEWLKKECGIRGITPAELARRAGVSKGYLHGVMDNSTDPGLANLQKIAAALNMGAGDMLVLSGYTVFKDSGYIDEDHRYAPPELELPILRNKVFYLRAQVLAIGEFLKEFKEGIAFLMSDRFDESCTPYWAKSDSQPDRE